MSAGRLGQAQPQVVPGIGHSYSLGWSSVGGLLQVKLPKLVPAAGADTHPDPGIPFR